MSEKEYDDDDDVEDEDEDEEEDDEEPDENSALRSKKSLLGTVMIRILVYIWHRL